MYSKQDVEAVRFQNGIIDTGKFFGLGAMMGAPDRPICIVKCEEIEGTHCSGWFRDCNGG